MGKPKSLISLHPISQPKMAPDTRRNPFNDIECGSYYARSLSSYALLNAFVGLTFDQRVGEIGFAPARPGDAVYFWSAGRGWGEIAFHGPTATLKVKGGELRVSRLRLSSLAEPVFVDGRPADRVGDVVLLGKEFTLRPGERIIVGAERAPA